MMNVIVFLFTIIMIILLSSSTIVAKKAIITTTTTIENIMKKSSSSIMKLTTTMSTTIRSQSLLSSLSVINDCRQKRQLHNIRYYDRHNNDKGRSQTSALLRSSSTSSCPSFLCPTILSSSLLASRRVARRYYYHHHHVVGFSTTASSSTSLSASIVKSHNDDEVKDDNNYCIDDNRNNNDVFEERYQRFVKASSKLSLAPMMDYTDVHFRYLIRLLSSQTLLYTEMIPSNALSRHYHDNNESIHDKSSYIHRALRQSPITSPWLINTNKDIISSNTGGTVIQLGGSNEQQMYDAAKCIMEYNENQNNQNNIINNEYVGINLNCGCPSPKVAGSGCFGASLMNEPDKVLQLVHSIHDGSNGQYPISVKCRIGTDTDTLLYNNNNNNHDNIINNNNKYNYILSKNDEEIEYNRLCQFIEIISSNGIVKDFQIHARIAILERSLSPSQNRQIPPLKYHYVHRLVNDYPHLRFSINGGFNTLIDIQNELLQTSSSSSSSSLLHGVMIGRALCANPWSFSMTDTLLYNEQHHNRWYNNRYDILLQYSKYCDYIIENDNDDNPIRTCRFLLKAIIQLFAGETNSKQYRIALNDISNNYNSNQKLSELIINAAIQYLDDEILYRTPDDSYQRLFYNTNNNNEEEIQQNNKKIWNNEKIMTSSSSSTISSSVLLSSSTNSTNGKNINHHNGTELENNTQTTTTSTILKNEKDYNDISTTTTILSNNNIMNYNKINYQNVQNNIIQEWHEQRNRNIDEEDVKRDE